MVKQMGEIVKAEDGEVFEMELDTNILKTNEKITQENK